MCRKTAESRERKSRTCPSPQQSPDMSARLLPRWTALSRCPQCVTKSGSGATKGNAAAGPRLRCGRCPGLGGRGGTDGPTATSGGPRPAGRPGPRPWPLAPGHGTKRPPDHAQNSSTFPFTQRLEDSRVLRPGDTDDAGPAGLRFSIRTPRLRDVEESSSRDGSTRSPVRAAQGQRPISAFTQRLENEPCGCAVSRSEPRGAN